MLINGFRGMGMAVKEITTKIYTCDGCEKEVNEGELTMAVKCPVKFMTEQTEGRPTTPYIQYATFDLCERCLDRALVFSGTGAQGYNNYRFRK